MISTLMDLETAGALAGSDLHNLAEGLAEEQLASERPAAAAARARGVVPPAPVATPRPECRPVAAGGMFATLHPECNQDYLERFQQLRTQLMLHPFAPRPLVPDFRTLAVMSTRRGKGRASPRPILHPRLACASNKGVAADRRQPRRRRTALGRRCFEGRPLPRHYLSRNSGRSPSIP